MKARHFRRNAKEVITVSMFHECHPDIIRNVGELFYTRVANRVHDILDDYLGDHIHDIEILIYTAIDIAAYLEDKVTGLNIWNAYEAIHRQKYGTAFPFYNISYEERYAEEPNHSDVHLLVSYDLNRYNDAKLINVMSAEIAEAADEIFNVLMDEYEYAPENTALYDWIYNAKAYKDPQKMRERIMFLFLSSYLTRVLDVLDLYDDYPDVKVAGECFEYGEREISYLMLCVSAMQTRLGPAAEPAGRWLAEMIRMSEDPEVSRNASRFDNFRSVPELMFYEVLSVNKKQMVVKTLYRNTITVSFDMLSEETKRLYKKGVQFFTHLFYYNNSWQINGVSQISEGGSDLFEEQSNSLIDQNEKKRQNYEVILKINGGNPIGVAKDYDSFMRKLKVNNVPNLSDEAIMEEVRDYKNILYFISKGENLCIHPDFARAVKLPYNRLYDRQYAMEMGMQLTLDYTLSEEMRQYIVSNNLMPESLFKGATDDAYNHKWYKQNRMCLTDMFHSDTRITTTFETYDTLFNE